MKHKKGADGGAGGHVEVGVKVIRPSVATLQQLKEDMQKEFYKECDKGWSIWSTPQTYTKLHPFLVSIIERAFTAGRNDRDD